MSALCMQRLCDEQRRGCLPLVAASKIDARAGAGGVRPFSPTNHDRHVMMYINKKYRNNTVKALASMCVSLKIES